MDAVENYLRIKRRRKPKAKKTDWDPMDISSLERKGGRGWPNHGVLGSPTLDKGETQQHPRQALPLPTQEMAIWAGMGMWLLYRQDFKGINSFFEHGTVERVFFQTSVDCLCCCFSG